MAFLTDQTLTSGVTLDDLIHIVNPNDPTQSPAGSSYKATIHQVISGFTGTTLYEIGSGTDSTQRIGTSNDSIGNCSVISGGFNNTSNTDYASILGGCSNIIENISSTTIVYPNTIGGGNSNTISKISTTQDVYSNTIGGGSLNTIQPILSGGQTISGGLCNENLNDFSTINGGFNNTILDRGNYIGGGSYNTSNGTRSVIVGGGGSCPALGNKTFCNYNFIGGGIQNTVNGTFSSIVGGGGISFGSANIVNSCYSTIIGGSRNVLSHEYSSAVGFNIMSKSACTLHVNYLSLYDLPVTDQTNNNVLVRDSSTGVVKLKNISTHSFGLFTQTSNSTPVSGTISETSILGSGVGTLSVPANGFSVGDSFRLVMGGHITFKNNDTLQVRIKANSVVLGDTGTIVIQNLTNRHWLLQVDFTIRSLGGPGVASIVSIGKFTYVKNASTSYEGSDFSTVENTLFDTTILNTLDVTVQYNSTSLVNNMYSELTTLTKTY